MRGMALVPAVNILVVNETQSFKAGELSQCHWRSEPTLVTSMLTAQKIRAPQSLESGSENPRSASPLNAYSGGFLDKFGRLALLPRKA